MVDSETKVAVSPEQVSSPVVSNREVMPGVYLIWLECPRIASTVKPGQFVMVNCGQENLLRRPFSVHQVRDKRDRLALLFSVVGKGTHWLSQRQVGDKIDLLGPMGNGYSIEPGTHNLLLVAGGIGVAPLSFLAQVAREHDFSVALLLGAATALQVCPGHLLPDVTRCITATEDGTAGKKGLITDLLPDYISWSDQVFACGPNSMYQVIARQNQKLLKPKPVQVSLEVMMACGLGLCYGCTVKTKKGLKQVCQDGPVFNLKDIIWDELMDWR